MEETVKMGDPTKSPTVMFQESGHDCPATPIFHPNQGVWICLVCDWSYEIDQDSCHICGFPDHQPPNPLPESELFLSFVEPGSARILSMHTSCAVQEYLSHFLNSISHGDEESTGGGIP